MTRLAAALAILALAGCGHDEKQAARKAVKNAREHISKAKDQADKALDQLKHSELPKDAQKQLEQAKQLLDKSN
jgi:hypothetical protein